MTIKLPSHLKASIVIRSYNEAATLKELLDVLFEQTMMSFEVIIVDNQSTDNTPSLLNNYPVATLVHLPKSEFNHAYSINIGMAVARTNLVVVTNGHCLPISRTWLEDGLSHFNDPKLAAVDGHYRSRRDGSKWEKLYDIIDANIQNNRLDNQPIQTTNVIIRKDVWQKYPFDESLIECEDYDWSKEVLFRGYKTIRDPRFNVYHSHNLTNQQIEERFRKWKQICHKIDSFPRPRSISSKVSKNETLQKIKIDRLF